MNKQMNEKVLSESAYVAIKNVLLCKTKRYW